MSSNDVTFPKSRLVSDSPIDSRTMLPMERNDFNGCSPRAKASPEVRER